MAGEIPERSQRGAKGRVRRIAEALMPVRAAAIVAAAAAGGRHQWGEGMMPDVGGVAGAQLKSLIERIERLEEEKRALGEDIKEVFAEAKGTGFDTKIMRQIIKIRKMDKDEHDEQESLLDLYMRALGMLPENAPRAEAPETGPQAEAAE
jgi:uncharacterized protein (UPF0335 family)